MLFYWTMDHGHIKIIEISKYFSTANYVGPWTMDR
jgi:hypothetical protein